MHEKVLRETCEVLNLDETLFAETNNAINMSDRAEELKVAF